MLADTAAKWLTVIAIVAGIGTFLYGYLTGQSLAFAMERMVTVIVICCPHALGLAVPLVVAKSTALYAKNGLLIENRRMGLVKKARRSKNELISNAKTETKEEPKTEAVNKTQPVIKDEPKDKVEPEHKANDEAKPDTKEKPTSKIADNSKAEVKDDSNSSRQQF